ncbi:MAG TPA: LamG domain-containing protein [Kofleriaceae bacterium]
MRALWLFALAACGRLEFGRERVTDGAPTTGDALASDGAPGDAPLDPSLVAWWRMEGYVGEGEAMGIADSTGVTNSLATCSGTTCPAIVPGKLGNAVSFDGVDDLLEAASMSSLVDDEFTVGAWIEMTRATTGENVQCAYGKGLGSSIYDSWSACVFSDLAAYFYSCQTTMSNELDSTTPMTLNAWHYLAIRFDGTTKALFEDGVLITSNTAAGVDYDDDPVFIGGDVDSGAPEGLFNGLIDEVRVYNRALSDAEIAALSQ